jgi:NAD(P)-dependent dehydrogenase (short-subunit alcohol dehydrogenase family)
MTDKVAIVTAASGGIGAAVARTLKARGYRLGLLARSDKLDPVAAELDAVAVKGSTAEAAALETLVEATLAAYGRIDGLVVHTGGPPKGDLLEIGDEKWIEGLDLVLLSVIRLCRLVTPVMERQGGGAIVAVSSFSAYEPDPRFPVSSALRAGLGAFAKLYADRYAAANIRMNCVLPGFTDSLNFPADFAETIPMKRIGKVEELAGTVAFLLSEEAGYITGQNLRVDGGFTRHV